MEKVLITYDEIDLYDAFRALGPPDEEEGATVVFGGSVRADEVNGKRVKGIEYEAYTEMALEQMTKIAEEAVSRFSLKRVWIAHRIGYVSVGELSFLVAIRASHRQEAFSAVSWITDEVKRRVPIWKKEHFEDGSARWKEVEK